MSANESFSSSSSTISYDSFHDNESASFNTSSSNSSASGISFLHHDGTFSSTDSNLDNPTDITDELLLKAQSGLYDISLDMSIDVPKDETFNKPDMLRAAVYTICGEIFFKNEPWRSISSLVAHQMGRSLNPTNSVWLPAKDKHVVYLGRTRISGHTLAVDECKLPIVYDDIAYSENICATNVKLSYFTEVFLTPAVAGAEKIYKSHGFRTDHDTCNYKKKHMADIWKGHKTEKLKDYDHHLAWAGVYNILQEYRDNISKQNKFFDEYGFSF